jgi:hypothetical protein
LNFETFDSLVVPDDGSAAADIAAALPQSRVLKAFNTTFAATLASGRIGDLPTTVLIAGDDAHAKTLLAGIVTAGAVVRAIDVGSLSRARELEALGFLRLTLAAAEKLPWTGGFGGRGLTGELDLWVAGREVTQSLFRRPSPAFAFVRGRRSPALTSAQRPQTPC